MKSVEHIATERGLTAAQVALAWLLSRSPDIVPIPGTKQQRYVEQNAAAPDVVLSPTELARLNDVFRPGAGAGERYPPGYFTTLGA